VSPPGGGGRPDQATRRPGAGRGADAGGALHRHRHLGAGDARGGEDGERRGARDRRLAQRNPRHGMAARHRRGVGGEGVGEAQHRRLSVDGRSGRAQRVGRAPALRSGDGEIEGGGGEGGKVGRGAGPGDIVEREADGDPARAAFAHQSGAGEDPADRRIGQGRRIGRRGRRRIHAGEGAGAQAGDAVAVPLGRPEDRLRDGGAGHLQLRIGGEARLARIEQQALRNARPRTRQRPEGQEQPIGRRRAAAHPQFVGIIMVGEPRGHGVQPLLRVGDQLQEGEEQTHLRRVGGMGEAPLERGGGVGDQPVEPGQEVLHRLLHRQEDGVDPVAVPFPDAQGRLDARDPPAAVEAPHEDDKAFVDMAGLDRRGEHGEEVAQRRAERLAHRPLDQFGGGAAAGRGRQPLGRPQPAVDGAREAHHLQHQQPQRLLAMMVGPARAQAAQQHADARRRGRDVQGREQRQEDRRIGAEERRPAALLGIGQVEIADGGGEMGGLAQEIGKAALVDPGITGRERGRPPHRLPRPAGDHQRGRGCGRRDRGRGRRRRRRRRRRFAHASRRSVASLR
jgi:hypothetical protein